MFVPDVGLALDDIDLEDMMLDPNSEGGNVGPNKEGTTTMQKGKQPQLDKMEDERVGGKQGMLQSANNAIVQHSVLDKSIYKHAALRELDIVNTGINDLEQSISSVQKPAPQPKQDIEKVVEQGDTSANPVLALQQVEQETSIGLELDSVMYKVETAMAALTESESINKVRRVIEMTSEEMRKLLNTMKENEKVQAVMLKDDEAVLYVSSETSGDSGEKKRKRKEKNLTSAGGVASRLRKKPSVGVQKEQTISKQKASHCENEPRWR